MQDAPAKLLLVEDNPGDARLVEELLVDDKQCHFQLVRANSLGSAHDQLERHDVAAILLDLKLPDGEGLNTLTRIHTMAPGIPIVVLSSEEDEGLAIRSVQLGAQDFLVKGSINGLLLRRSLSYAIERKRMAEQLHHLAHHDALTGLANRKLFYDRLQRSINAARRSGKRAVLMFLDLTGFKAINDSLGHQVGDLLLQGVSQRLTDCVRASDCVARLGGDEFTVLLDDVSGPEDILPIAQKILGALSEPFTLESAHLVTHASLGVALFPDDSDDAASLVRAADAAMYQAKAAAPNDSCFRFFSKELAAKTQGYADYARRLGEAFEQGEFVLHYQPEVDIRSGTVIGMEALLRWQHPQEGLLMPARFMDALEETGLIVPVGAWILRSACEQNTAWQKMGLPPLAVSVNISPRQFRQRDFVDSVAAALERTAMRGSLLELEFTEDLLRENEEHSVRTLDSLNRLGVKLTLDNFGSGVVSFKSLMKFPIHAIKIDRSLIQDASHNASGAAIAKAAIEVAHIFHIKGLAEGVETSAHLDTVKRIACDDAQGYLYSPPLPPSAFAELIQGNRPLHENSLQ